MNFTKKPTDEAFSKNMYYNNFTQQKKKGKNNENSEWTIDCLAWKKGFFLLLFKHNLSPQANETTMPLFFFVVLLTIEHW